MNKMNVEKTEAAVLVWAHNRGILKNGNVATQMLKSVSEVGELADAIAKNDRDAVIDGIGDVLVTLAIVANMHNTSLMHCFNVAYDVIKDRKGFLNENGVFVKEE